VLEHLEEWSGAGPPHTTSHGTSPPTTTPEETMTPPTAEPDTPVPEPPEPTTLDERKVEGPLLRDPPPPPGWVDPLEGSRDLEDLATTYGTEPTRGSRTPASA
jgi:hypothetical protein